MLLIGWLMQLYDVLAEADAWNWNCGLTVTTSFSQQLALTLYPSLITAIASMSGLKPGNSLLKAFAPARIDSREHTAPASATTPLPSAGQATLFYRTVQEM